MLSVNLKVNVNVPHIQKNDIKQEAYFAILKYR